MRHGARSGHVPGAAIVLLGASAAACLISARRATRINPVDAPREE
jgi:ABC-type antimicrobial peptide transport system permease subunit